MSETRTRTGILIVTVALGAPLAAQTPPKSLPTKPVLQVQKAAALDVATARKLIQERVTDKAVGTKLETLSQSIGRLHDPSIVGAWGLGCGAGCNSNSQRWSDMPMAQRTAAIKADAKLSDGDRKLLLEINTGIEDIGRMKKDMVGAWGLGCGGGCNRATDKFGQVAKLGR